MHTSIDTVAPQVFAQSFFDGDVVRAELRQEAPLKRALALLPSGVSWGQLNALALSVRELGGLEPQGAAEPMSPAQRTAFDGLRNEPGLPAPFRAVLNAAQPRLQLRRDLYALYGVLAGTLEKLTTLGSVAELAVEEPKQPLTPQAPRGLVRG